MSFDDTNKNLINTNKFSSHLRGKGIIVNEKKILISKYEGSLQAHDITDPVNCNGYGRIRHFRLGGKDNWPQNPLPILPAAKALGLPPDKEIRAQVFQNSVCNWRCWYCFVDYSLLSGDRKHADFFTCDELLNMYLEQNNPPLVIDLTGGQPDLTPEWVPWMMEALMRKGLQDKIFLWSDDNLSNDYLWQYLTESQLDLLTNYKMYARVCCFKGIDEESFSLNTKAEPSLFNDQFELCSKLLSLGIELYCYITITARTSTNFEETIPRLFDKMQAISPNLPLRTVPLEILEFTPLRDRMNEIFRDMIKGQYTAIEVWQKELEKRFDSHERNKQITDVVINRR
jgi:uncharacterized Fe-S cluster-containing radical SAM superfamily protein